LLNELGVPTRWQVLDGDPRFQAITRKIHSALHGWPAALEPEERDYFHEVSARAARELALEADLVLVHDPEPVALAGLCRRPRQRWVGRSPVALARAPPAVWGFLDPTAARHDAAVFSHVAFAPPLPLPSYLVSPSIDPMSDRNRDLDDEEQDAL